MKYIQLIGTQRSGSNLLRLMLNQLDDISAPHPPHILSTFLPVLEKYGNLKTSKNLNNLILDVCKWIKLNPIKWENFDVLFFNIGFDKLLHISPAEAETLDSFDL